MGLFETIEKKRQEVMQRRNETGAGTLKGLAEVIRKRKEATMQPVMPKKTEKSNAK